MTLDNSKYSLAGILGEREKWISDHRIFWYSKVSKDVLNKYEPLIGKHRGGA